ncbi:MAG: hypothetical protein Q9214_000611 [Letrouitia sp. 1 TL-2023]
MPKHHKSLSLALPQGPSPIGSAITTPTDIDSPLELPRTPLEFDNRLDKLIDDRTGSVRDIKDTRHERSLGSDVPGSPIITSLPPIPSSPKHIARHGREQSKSFFANLKAAKSSNKVHRIEPTIRKVPDDYPNEQPVGEEKTLYSLPKASGSSPDLTLSTLNPRSLGAPGGKRRAKVGQDIHANARLTDLTEKGDQGPRRPVGPSMMSDSALVTNSPNTAATRRAKPRFAQLLTRTRSIRTDDGGRRTKPTTPILTKTDEAVPHCDSNDDSNGLKTAPLQYDKDRSFRDLMGSAIRNKSADRQSATKKAQGTNSTHQWDNELSQGLSGSSSTVLRDMQASNLFTNLKNTSSKAADGLGKAGKGLFTKMARTGSSYAREHSSDSRYECKVLQLPLVEQTRRTRIAQRLEDSRDKTEFWMPALPWRCIDYLNFRGCEEEGLYRVPGSGAKVKEYQERFDRGTSSKEHASMVITYLALELDVNLFDDHELYDINIIGSLFKAWLRDLPTEILPKAVQEKVSKECAGATEVPQLFKDELSMLPPWNYYLLFATTCHLSLLHAYVEKNKMNYNNLCICFQPCLKIDAFSFHFLVCDWRNCWQGCWTEKQYLEEEYRVLDGHGDNNDGLDSSGGDSSQGSTAVAEERSLPSSGSSKQNNFSSRKPPPLSIPDTREQQPSYSNGHTRSASQLPELQPMVPLSPIGL